MNKSTLRKWSRDALETLHRLKHETNDTALQAKRHAHRVVALTDVILSTITLEEKITSDDV